MIPLIQNFRTVILANGDFPVHAIPLEFLNNSERIICCDGAANNLIKNNILPNFIIGDLDSINEKYKNDFSNILVLSEDQETNDLTKAVKFCLDNNWKKITILGATGKREDHTLGNLSLLSDYSETADVQLLTDYGVFNCIFNTNTFESFRGEQISIFSLEQNSILSSENLRFPIKDRKFSSLWEGTLNESESDNFTISFEKGKVLVFREY